MGSVEEQRRQQGYFVRLGSLSARLRHLAYEHSLGKLRRRKHHAQDTLAQLQETLELVRALCLPPFPPRDAGQHAWIECPRTTWSPASLKGGGRTVYVQGWGRGTWGWRHSVGVKAQPGEAGRGFVEEGKL